MEHHAACAYLKQNLPEYRQFDDLKGQEIWLGEAARKYRTFGVYSRLLTAWVQKGYIRKIRDDGNRVVVDEQDVAYCCHIYRKHKHKNRRIFNDDGTPWTPRT